MKLLILHLSDIHLRNREDAFKIDVDKMVQGLNSIGPADECLIAISGDLAFSGCNKEYRIMSSLLGAIIKKLVQKKFPNKHIHICCVPGNHDIDFDKIARGFDEINEAQKINCLENIINHDIECMNQFYAYANYHKCFSDDKIISKRVINVGTNSIRLVMLNTAPLSLLGGNSVDMGIHCLLDNDLKQLEEAADLEINILIMHHSLEWFSSYCKDKLRKIIATKYSLVLTGHEHEIVGENIDINNLGRLQCVQGNALLGSSENGNGFVGIIINLELNSIKGYSYIWEKDFYCPSEIINEKLKIIQNGFIKNRKNYIENFRYNDDKELIENYFIFPKLSCKQVGNDEEINSIEIDVSSELISIIKQNDRILFLGERKSGKTTIAKKIYLTYCNSGKYPLFFNIEDLNLKKIDRLVQIEFEEQYDSSDSGYSRFLQIDIEDRIALIDGGELLNKIQLEKIMSYFENFFSKIIIFSEEKISFDIHKQVVDAFNDKRTVEISIKPFWYNKRKELIKKVLESGGQTLQDIKIETNKINDLINSQIKYFNLTPDFIINFIKQYIRDYRFQFMTGTSIFSVVYENTVRNRIIDNAENIDVNLVLNILREIAYFMHFDKKRFINLDEINDIISIYKKDYRQKVNVRLFLDAVTNAKILIEVDNCFRFKDHTIIAYFVAQAINQKYNQDENIDNNIDYLLSHLCFNINSDIVLFLALITNNPKFINAIIDGAKKHFKDIEELDFDKNNMEFLTENDIPIKNSIPNKDEKKKRDDAIANQEEQVKISELIEIVNEYEYTEEDLNKLENQVVISIKYLEILSKTLPAFCHNMKVSQQDILVELIYRYPNKFLFSLLNDINKNFESFVEDLYKEISELRKEKNISEVDIKSVRKFIGQISAVLVLTIYQLVSNTASSDQSIDALDSFDWNKNTNYKIMNLMMNVKTLNVSDFTRKAIKLDRQLSSKLEKSMVRYIVRSYFLSHDDIEIYGDAQRLLDHFFGHKETPVSEKRKIKIEMVKGKIQKIDHT
ncbi:metallophosphoesterase [Clostridium sp. E02]|uniref:metallophosphoesterase n=1 Tax=Clostridium sp. E02 TaxID=2487134 RepID=UPI0013DE380E|nr:metallophosphoesterase [Clostridium sp. E02]